MIFLFFCFLLLLFVVVVEIEDVQNSHECVNLMIILVSDH